MAQRKIQSYQLGDTGVVPGPYTSANVTVDAAGRITAIANGSGGGSVVEPDMQVVYGTGTGVTSDSSLTYDVGTETLTVGATGDAVIKSFDDQGITIESGEGTVGDGGPITIRAGQSAENGGDITIQGGYTSDSGQTFDGGTVNIFGGDADLTNDFDSGLGGVVNIRGGNAGYGPGQVNIDGGFAAGSGIAGAPVQITGGGSALGHGGRVTIAGADALGTNRDGGDVELYAGNGTNGAGADGGDIVLSAGTGVGIGGNLLLTAGTGATNGVAKITTGGVERFSILGNGAWSIGPSGTDIGTAGQVLTSAGPGLPPAWSTGGGGGSLWQITQYTENGGKNTVDRLWPLPIIGADRQELFSPYRTIIDSDTPVQGNEDYFLATINATAANQKAETAGVSRDGLWAGAIYDDAAIQFYTPLLSYIDTEPQAGGYINKVVSMPSGFSGICFDADQDVVLIGETDEDGDPFLDSYVTVIGLNNQQLGNNTIDWQNRYQYSGFYLFPVGMGPINSISNFGISLAQAFSTGFASTTGILTKFDSTTGATQWRREISGMTNGNMSVAMNTFTSPNSKIFFSSDDTIIGLNESGSILWQRRVTLMSQFTGPYFVSQVYGLSGNNWVIAVISGADGCGLIGLNATTGATEFSVSLPDVQLEAGISVVYTGNELVVVGKYFADPNLIILVSMDAIGGYNSAKLFEFNSSGSPYTPYISGDFSPDISSGLVNNVRIGFKLQNDFNDDLSLGALLSVDADQALGTTNLSASATGLSMTVSDFTSSSPSNTATLVAGSYTIATPVGITEDNPGYTLVNPANVTTVATRLGGPLLAPLQASLEVKNGLSVGQLQLDGLLPPPVNSKGTLGDVLGMVRFDTDYIYYCYQTYTNGTPNIWSRTQVTDNGLW